jgi:hypothetical protein
MARAAGRSVCLGLAKRDHCGGVRALRDEPVGCGLDGLVRAVFACRSVQLLEIAVSDSLYPFVGAAVGAVVSGYFWVLARREGRTPLMWTMALAAGAFFVAALLFGSQV